MGFKDYEGKNIYVMLNSKRIYTGVVKEVVFVGQDTNDIDIYIFTLIDKFGKLVSFSNKEISVIDEQDLDYINKKKGEKNERR
jgi:hypothetical protein